MNRKRSIIKLIVLASAIAIGIAPTAFAQSEMTADVEATDSMTGASASELTAQAQGDVVDVASSSDDFSTLVTALQTAELVDALKSEGPFTVFAPPNEAFDALPEGVLDTLLMPENRDLLTEVLTYHVIPGEIMSDDLSTGMVEALNGDEIMVNVADDAATVNDVTIVGTDIPATNGVIHVIDEVLIPEDVVAELESRLMTAEEDPAIEETPPTVTEEPAPEPIPALW